MNRKISIEFKDIAGKAVKFEGMREFVDFIKSEAEFWRDQHKLLDENESQDQIHPVLNYHEIFNQLLQTIDAKKEETEQWGDDELQNQINQLMRGLHSSSSNWLWSGHPFIVPFLECHKKHGQLAAKAFITFVIKNESNQTDSRLNIDRYDAFLGAMLGCEFVVQDPELLQRRNGEQASLEHLRNQFAKQTTQLTSEVEAFKVRMQELENTYQEKLRLEKPAKYWKDSAFKLGIQGGLWSLALITSLVLGFVYFSNFFTEWLRGNQIPVQLGSLQGVVIFGTILAIYAFLLKTLSKLTFSAFHLMRDAQERQQLTYLYLSLVNESKVDETSRDIVLQALFSRSDSGLLTNESKSKLPDIGEVIRATSRIR